MAVPVHVRAKGHVAGHPAHWVFRVDPHPGDDAVDPRVWTAPHHQVMVQVDRGRWLPLRILMAPQDRSGVGQRLSDRG